VATGQAQRDQDSRSAMRMAIPAGLGMLASVMVCPKCQTGRLLPDFDRGRQSVDNHGGLLEKGRQRSVAVTSHS
jgi:hypothetical protein